MVLVGRNVVAEAEECDQYSERQLDRPTGIFLIACRFLTLKVAARLNEVSLAGRSRKSRDGADLLESV